MGLDMYLTREHYVKNWDHMKPEYRHTVTVTRNGGTPTSIKPERVQTVIEEVAYWRKANQIHAWFVRNIQDGKDDCGQSYVGRDDLQRLLSEVETVLSDRGKAQEILPSQGGFFFGSTEYDDCYFQDLEDTKRMLTEILAEPDEGIFYYHSSW